MRFRLFIFLNLLGMMPVLMAEQSPTSSKGAKRFRFNGSEVSGQYQNSGESTVVVEEEKNLDDLLGVRKNFRDRIERMKAQTGR